MGCSRLCIASMDASAASATEQPTTESTFGSNAELAQFSSATLPSRTHAQCVARAQPATPTARDVPWSAGPASPDAATSAGCLSLGRIGNGIPERGEAAPTRRSRGRARHALGRSRRAHDPVAPLPGRRRHPCGPRMLLARRHERPAQTPASPLRGVPVPLHGLHVEIKPTESLRALVLDLPHAPHESASRRRLGGEQQEVSTPHPQRLSIRRGRCSWRLSYGAAAPAPPWRKAHPQRRSATDDTRRTFWRASRFIALRSGRLSGHCSLHS